MKTCILRTVACLAVLASLSLATFATANPVGGSVSGVSRVASKNVNVHLIAYKGGEQADFSITGDGDTTLNIIVKDRFGNEIARTRGPGDRCRATWTPTQTGTYFIYVVNEGNVYNEYRWHGY
jgi:hypothetical protein